MSRTAPAFRLSDATVVLGGEPVFRSVSLEVLPGDFLVILGGNGAGKSTLLRALLGLIPLESGTVEIWGQDPKEFRRWEQIAYVPQHLTSSGAVPVSVLEVVASGQYTPGRRRHRPDRALVRDALESVALWHRRHESVSNLSGGQQRRVMIARALARGSRTILLDEPTAGVDEASRAQLYETLATLRGSGATVLMVTHELTGVRDLATRCVAMANDGSPGVRFLGPPPQQGSLDDPEGHHEPPTGATDSWGLPI